MKKVILIFVLAAFAMIAVGQEPLYLTVLKAVDGRFGKRVLIPQYRRWWRVMTYGALAFMFFRFVVCPFFAWWDKVVAFLNYVIWG